jgi:phosphoribosylanthranilate isomerase
MLVKICGIKSKEAAIAAAEAGADFIGFVFAESKRRLSPEQAAEIGRVIPAHVKKVGVFVNESPSVIEEIAGTAGLDVIQLHGDETKEFQEKISLLTIKSFEMSEDKDLKEIEAFSPTYYLLDSPVGKYRGGNGTAFEWSLTEQLSIPKEKIMLAGGLTVENVADAILTVKPGAVDVSSGVETNGEKDLEKIKAFIKNAKQSFQLLKESEGK